MSETLERTKYVREEKKLRNRAFGLPKVEKAITDLLTALAEEYGIDPKDENFIGTPKRVSRLFCEIFEGMVDTENEVEEILSAAYEQKYDEMVTVGPIETFAVCPHHLLPVEVISYVGYIPNGKVLGLSKLARLVQLLSAQPILQEKLTVDITDKLMDVLGAKGAGCVIRARHFCMCMRGARSRNSWTATSSMVGVLRDKPEARQEFLALVSGMK